MYSSSKPSPHELDLVLRKVRGLLANQLDIVLGVCI